jgi:hypothetical protein
LSKTEKQKEEGEEEEGDQIAVEVAGPARVVLQ